MYAVREESHKMSRLADGFSFLWRFGLQLDLAHRMSFLCKKNILPSVTLKLWRKFAFGWIFFPESDKLWQGGKEGGEWAIMEAISWLTAVGVLNSCESVLWDTLAFLCIHSDRKWQKHLCKGKLHQQVGSSCVQSYDQLFVSQLCWMPSISKRNICSELVSNSLTSIRQTQ